MKIVTWNVNSIRARLPLFCHWLKEQRPDVVLLQETKCLEAEFPRLDIEDLGYNIAVMGQKTFNGVAILARSPIEDVVRGLPTYPEDTQARYIEAVVGKVRVASVYVPNGQTVGSEKFAYKLEFLSRLRQHLQGLLAYEEIGVVGGDYNIAPTDEDVNKPEVWHEQILCSTPERQQFRSLLHLGYTDAIRVHHQGSGPFSWWDYRTNAFVRGDGLRIDHLLVSPQAVACLQSSGVDTAPRAMEKASDHAPVWCTLHV
jgi:exodeoxyribonuclease-3